MARHASPEEEEEEENELDELERAEAVLAERKQKKSKGSKGKEKERSSKSKGKRRESDRNEDAPDSDGVDGDDSDEEGGGRRGTGKAKKGLSESDITEKARDLVRYAICNEASRRPLRRDEINKKVLAGASRSFQRVFEDANEMLKTTFGMELVALYPAEVEDVQPEAGKRKKKKKNGDDDDNATTSEDETADRPKSRGKKRKGLAKMFCLRSTLAEELIRKAVKSNDDLAPQAQIRLYEDLRGSLGDAFAGAGQEEERRGGRNVGDDDLKEWKRGEDAIFDWKTGPEQRTLFGILYVILALILVNERVLTDEQLQSHLKRLELRLETPLPLNPGAIRPEKQTANTFLQTLIRQQYLEKSKLATGTNAKSKGGSSATQATQTQTQRVRATQGTNKKQTNDDAIAGGDPDAEWRWGPRAFREVGEDGIASFIKDFYRSHSRTAAMAGAETTQKDSKTLMADIQRGATGGKPGSTLIKARDEDD